MDESNRINNPHLWKIALETCSGFVFGISPKLDNDFKETQSSYEDITELGLYDFSNKSITIFRRKIEGFGKEINCDPETIEAITLAHELAHAISHLGVDPNCAHMKDLDAETKQKTMNVRGLLAPKPPFTEYEHEQLAQILTLGAIRAVNTSPERRNELMDVFRRMMTRQPRQYRIEALLDVTDEQIADFFTTVNLRRSTFDSALKKLST